MYQVAPFTGAWIETYLAEDGQTITTVAPFTGAWIETVEVGWTGAWEQVAPFTGAWIETSLPLLIRLARRRTLHGCVD